MYDGTLAESVYMHIRERGCDLDELSQRIGGHRVVVVDQPGMWEMYWEYEDGSRLYCEGRIPRSDGLPETGEATP